MGSLPATIGPYRVIRKLGEGGMGAVFEAIHEVIRRRVAIKVLHPQAGRSADSINRFINEARAANLIGHPGLVQITDFGSLPDGAGFLVMEYLPGQTLADRLAQNAGKLSPSEAVQIGLEITSALATVHKKRIIHRDLKPGNIMLVPDPAMPTGERVKILDFGLAKLAEVREAAIVKTSSNAVLGTPLYMSPEQCQGAGQVDDKTDVYSLGCMLYEMLAGQTPFLGEGSGMLIAEHVFMPPKPLGTLAPAIPAAVTVFVDRLLAKNKDERPSMREVYTELEVLAQSLPPPPRRKEVEGSGAEDSAEVAALPPAQTRKRVATESGKATELGDPDPAGDADVPFTATQGIVAVESKIGAMAGPRKGKLTLGSFVLLGVFAGTWMIGRHNRVPSSAQLPSPAAAVLPQTGVGSVASANPPPRIERTIRWSITTTPPGAALVDPQGTLLGETPWALERPTEGGTATVRLRRAGYVDKMLILKLNENEEQNVVLEPLRAPSLSKISSNANGHPAKPPARHRKEEIYIDE